ncbi:Histone-lysine N-methyltransferase set9, partial [Cladochytrium tenue]
MLCQEIQAAHEGRGSEMFSRVLAAPPQSVLLLDYVNTDPQPKLGRHWQMVAARGDGQSYYACSLGSKPATHAFLRVTRALKLCAELAELLNMNHDGWAMPGAPERINVPEQINGDCCGDLVVLNGLLLASATSRCSIPPNLALEYTVDKRLVREVRSWIAHVKGTVVDATTPDGHDYVSNLGVALEEAGHGALAGVLSGKGDVMLVLRSDIRPTPRLPKLSIALRLHVGNDDRVPASAAKDEAQVQFISEDISRAILADGPLVKTRKIVVAGDLASELPHGFLMSLENHKCSHSRCDVDKACRAVGKLMSKATKNIRGGHSFATAFGNSMPLLPGKALANTYRLGAKDRLIRTLGSYLVLASPVSHVSLMWDPFLSTEGDIHLGLVLTKAVACGEPVPRLEGWLPPMQAVSGDTNFEAAGVLVYKKRRYFVCGPAGLVNHSCDPNCKYEVDEKEVVRLVATQKINPGSALTVSYGNEFFGDGRKCKCWKCSSPGSPLSEGWAASFKLRHLCVGCQFPLPPVLDSDWCLSCSLRKALQQEKLPGSHKDGRPKNTKEEGDERDHGKVLLEIPGEVTNLATLVSAAARACVYHKAKSVTLEAVAMTGMIAMGVVNAQVRAAFAEAASSDMIEPFFGSDLSAFFQAETRRASDARQDVIRSSLALLG